MKQLACLFLAALLLPFAPAQAQRKVSPYIRQLSRERSVCAFVQVDGADAAELLRRHGCRQLASQGDISIAMIPLSRLDGLSACREVRRIEASRSCQLTMDTTRQVVNAMPVYEGRALPQAYTGQGVVLGLMDVGFDLTHPTFLSADGHGTRIRRFWDMLSPDTVGSRLPVGRDFVTSEAIAAVQRATDGLTETHGTHTLGIAAGAGYGSPYQGMAPGSDICLVANAVSSDTLYIDEADYDKYTSATDALGFKYIFDYADSLGLPCVISFSEGFRPSFTADDYLFGEFVEGLLGPGHILVTSAGNESYNPKYLCHEQGGPAAGAFLSAGDLRVATCFLRTRGNARLSVMLSPQAAAGPTDSLSFSTFAISGVSTDSVCYSQSCRLDGNGYYMEVYKYPSAYDPSDTICYVQLLAERSLAESCRMAYVISGDACELWASQALDNQAPWADAQIRSNVLQPGCLRRVITVGSTVHRTGFTNYLGEYRDFSRNGSGGRRSAYSSVGPTFQGLTKPDVCAPGDNIVSAYSSFYLEHNPTAGDLRSDVAHFDYQGRRYAWNSNAGTSMACPVVAGAIALWLQARPDLSPEDVVQLFEATCRRPEPDLAYPNNEYGYGEIDVYRGLLALLGIDAVRDISLHQPADVRFALDPDGSLRLTFADAAAVKPTRLKLFDLSGRLVYTAPLAPDASATVTVALPPLPPAVYVVQLDGHGSTLVRL